MRIAIDCRLIGKSGIGTFLENVVDSMLGMHPEHDYLLIMNHDTLLTKRMHDAYIIKTSIAPFSLSELLFFPVGQINECEAYFTPYINIPSGIKIPVYSTIHDMLFFDMDGLVSPIGKCIRKFFYRRTIKRSEKIFTVSEFSKERIWHHFPTENNIMVIPNGVSNQIRSFHVADEKKEDYYIFVGNVKKHKGIRCLLEAFAEARRSGMKSRLYIVGEYEKFRTSDSQLKEYLCSEGVEFTGYLPNEMLWEMIAKAKALIQPSEYEGFGIPPLEALYLGTNVILSDISVFKEIYHDLPVTFFGSGNSHELRDIFINFHPTALDVEQVRKDIERKYSYDIAADKIFSEMV